MYPCYKSLVFVFLQCLFPCYRSCLRQVSLEIQRPKPIDRWYASPRQRVMTGSISDSDVSSTTSSVTSSSNQVFYQKCIRKLMEVCEVIAACGDICIFICFRTLLNYKTKVSNTMWHLMSDKNVLNFGLINYQVN